MIDIKIYMNIYIFNQSKKYYFKNNYLNIGSCTIVVVFKLPKLVRVMKYNTNFSYNLKTSLGHILGLVIQES